MTVTPDLETLHDQNHKALLDFLTIELDLGFTFMDWQRLRTGAADAINVVEHFNSRIEDPSAKSTTERRTATLKGLIAEASGPETAESHPS